MADKARNGRFLAGMLVLMASVCAFVEWSLFRGFDAMPAGAWLCRVLLVAMAASVPGMRVLVTSGRAMSAYVLRAGGYSASLFMLFFLADVLRELAAAAAALISACGGTAGGPLAGILQSWWASVWCGSMGRHAAEDAVAWCGASNVVEGTAACVAEFLWSPWAAGGTLCVCAAAVAMLMHAASCAPCVVRRNIHIHGLPDSLRGMRIAHIADLHGGPLVAVDRMEAIAESIRKEKPGMVCITGDFSDGTPGKDGGVMSPLLSLGGEMPVFICMGNHDMYHAPQAWRRQWEEHGFKVLLNSHVDMDFRETTLRLAGIADSGAAAVPGEPLPDLEAAAGAGDAFTILLAHRPGCAAEASRMGVALQLSGHTHGGQMMFLFPLVRFCNAGFRRGVYNVGKMVLHVTTGCGQWSYAPMRLGVSSEIAMLTLQDAG